MVGSNILESGVGLHKQAFMYEVGTLDTHKNIERISSSLDLEYYSLLLRLQIWIKKN